MKLDVTSVVLFVTWVVLALAWAYPKKVRR
jgi:hypothetical protein